jgi:ATP-dependent Lon protease
MKSVIEIDLSKKNVYSVLPLKDLIFFPHMVVPLIVGRKQSIEAIEQAMSGDKMVFLVAQKEARREDVQAKDLFRFGVIGRILQIVKLPNNLEKILVEGINRGKVLRYFNEEKLLRAQVSAPIDDSKLNHELEAKKRQVVALFKDYVKLNEDIPEEILFTVNQFDDIERLTDFVSTYLDIRIKDKQNLLSKWKLDVRLDLLLSILNKENSVLNIKSELDFKVRDHMIKSQRHYFLQEQLRVIREELGEEGEIDDEIAYLRKKLQEAKPPKEVEEKAFEELQRLGKIPPLSPEYNVIRTFLEWIVALPWQQRTDDEHSIKIARTILDEDHYGLQKPKKRILEFIAVLQRVRKLQGPILCLSGPPGVGKTSLGKSIARALGRKFVRISLGGVHDEAEIRGHRRTYIGSMPGKIIQGMKKAQTINPVFLLDEVDKLGMDYHGDPASALLEVLDPEQNRTFIDHYMEVEYDLSNVLFLVTANNPGDIPDALLDRMEVIELPGYLDFEKIEIAKRHLIPKQKELNGLQDKELVIEEEALREMIINYTLEAGVRNLEREISKICRKSVVELSQSRRKETLKISVKQIPKFLGEIRFPLSKLQHGKEIGVATGLAWTPYGGDLLRVEVNLMPGKDKLTLTGKLGEVMQESAMIAVAYIRSQYRRFKIEQNFMAKSEVHIHLPEGAVPKDGPSAGVTLASALLSALKKKSYPEGIAMTGEITLRGKVLAVGGLNEKLLAAKRHGIKKVLLPFANKSDIKEMSKELLEDLELTFVNNYEQVYELIFEE